MFEHQHRVQFYETDQMGIVHHSNYLRFFEEARVAWAYDRKIINFQNKNSAAQLAVIDSHVRYVKPAHFGDLLAVEIQGRLDGPRITFEYKIRCQDKGKDAITTGRTQHVSLDENLRLRRPDESLRLIMEKEKWIETWL